MYRATAYFGQLSVCSVIQATDIESATISAELAYSEADMIIVEAC